MVTFMTLLLGLIRNSAVLRVSSIIGVSHILKLELCRSMSPGLSMSLVKVVFPGGRCWLWTGVVLGFVLLRGLSDVYSLGGLGWTAVFLQRIRGPYRPLYCYLSVFAGDLSLL